MSAATPSHFPPPPLRRRVDALLGFLVVLDAVLAAVALFSPATWASAMHGLPQWDDPHHMLRRLGCVWLAFLLMQFAALTRWKRDPVWLAVVAGARWSEMCADGIYWASSDALTWFGHMGFLSSPPANIAYGLYLVSAFRRMQRPLP